VANDEVGKAHSITSTNPSLYSNGVYTYSTKTITFSGTTTFFCSSNEI